MYFKSILLGSAILLSGCANLNSINHKKSLSEKKPAVFSMDARQRTVLSRPTREVAEMAVEDDNGNLAIKKTAYESVRICAEQFPDVFTVLSASLSAQLDAKNDKEVQSLSGNLAAAMQESGTTIARTQTVNLLREAMYRTCERYMNGALDKDNFALQAIRDQQSMVSVLAIEQLTGVITPPSSSLFGASGSFNQTKLDPTALAAMLNDAKIGRDKAKQEEETAQNAYDNALKAAGKSKCEDITEADKKSTCETTKASLDTAKEEYETAQKHYNSVSKLVDGMTKSINAALAVGLANNQNNINNNANAARIEAVARAVSSIVAHTYDSNNMETACIQLLLSRNPENREALFACSEALKEKIKAKATYMMPNTYSSYSAPLSTYSGTTNATGSTPSIIYGDPGGISSPVVPQAPVSDYKQFEENLSRYLGQSAQGNK